MGEIDADFEHGFDDDGVNAGTGVGAGGDGVGVGGDGEVVEKSGGDLGASGVVDASEDDVEHAELPFDGGEVDCWRFCGEPVAFEPEGCVDEADEGGDFNEWADDSNEGFAGVEAEDGNRDGDCELEVIACGGKGEGGSLGVVGAEFASHPEADEEHDGEVDEEGDGDAGYVERESNDEVAFEREHDENGEEQCDEGEGTNSGNEDGAVPELSLGADEGEASEHSCEERDAEIDEDALSDACYTDVDYGAVEAEPCG